MSAIETPFIIISIALLSSVPIFFWGSWFGFPSSCLAEDNAGLVAAAEVGVASCYKEGIQRGRV